MKDSYAAATLGEFCVAIWCISSGHYFGSLFNVNCNDVYPEKNREWLVVSDKSDNIALYSPLGLCLSSNEK